MIEINADSVKNKNLAVADILDSYTGKLAQSKDILIRMSNEEYLTTISALRYAISFLREDSINRKELKKRALSIVDIYLTLNKITDREAEILRKAILG